MKHLHENPGIIILDYYLDAVQKDAANGIEVLKVIRKHQDNIHVIILSSQEQYGIKDQDAFANVAEMIDKM